MSQRGKPGRFSEQIQADTIMELQADLVTCRFALVSSQSVLSYIYHRERSRLSEDTQQQVWKTLCDVERAIKVSADEQSI